MGRGWYRALFSMVVGWCAATTSFAGTLRTVALTGQQAPGTTTGTTFSFSSVRPVLNDAGEVAFLGRVTGPDVTNANTFGIWSEVAGSGLRLVAREGDSVPGTNAGVVFDNFHDPQLNDSGQVAFHGILRGAGVSSSKNVGVWSEGRGNGLEKIARAGDTAPGGNLVFNSLGDIALNNAGQTAFVGSLTGPGINSQNNNGLWAERNGALELILREGAAAPGVPGAVFGDLLNPTLNDAGGLAIGADLAGAGITTANKRGVWRQLPGESLKLLAQQGQPLPAAFGNHELLGLGNLSEINEAGQVAIAGTVKTVGSTRIVVDPISGTLNPAATAGDAAAGTPPGVVFSTLNDTAMNGSGQIVFEATLSGPGVGSHSRNGVWKQAVDGTLELVAREGDHAPGAPDGVKFDVATGNNSSFSWLVITGHGQVAFQAFVVGPGLGNPSSGIWAQDIAGQLHLIARAGDQIEVAPNDLRTISEMELFGAFAGGMGNESGYSTGFNELGQVAFSANFTDGSSGIFVSNLVMVPEPGTLSLAGCGLLATVFSALRRRRRTG